MWFDESVFYQIYPLGLCGAPAQNDGVCSNRIARVKTFVPHLQRLGVNAVYFGPVFDSDAHGYDTRDYAKVDCRLGTNADFADVCGALHAAGIRVVLDGVFNHVGRGFWAFRDVQQNRENSPYKDWFRIDFNGSSNYNDGFWYEGWEGHYELVKLNLQNPAVVDYLCGCVRGWVREFGIDGLRLDVAYCLDEGFVRRLRALAGELAAQRGEAFFLLGEMLHGDYSRLVNDAMLDSATNYECYKGLWSAFNSNNLFEIAHSLNRQFGPEPWTLYKGKHLFCFADNHDVTRIASLLANREQLRPLYAVLFGMPGIPCLYCGSEWGAEGRKEQGDAALRAAFAAPQWNALTDFLAACTAAHRQSRALQYGDFHTLLLTNRQCIFERAADGERVLVAVNADGAPFEAHFNANAGRARDLLTGAMHDFGGGSHLEPYAAHFWRVE